MLQFRARACRERISDSVGMSQGVRGTRLRGVVRCSKSLPLCPRGLDEQARQAEPGFIVAPVPAWAGRSWVDGDRCQPCCPCARVGRTRQLLLLLIHRCVAPVPAWAGRELGVLLRMALGCPCARVGRT